jgi:hypothetical protein
LNRPTPPAFLFLRLSSSRDTAASSTHRVLADLALAAAPDAEIDFAFLPPKRAPRVTGLFSGRDWAAFDLILVTNSFVQEAINLPWLLHANGLSPWATERSESFPPLLLGGSNAFAAQCLVRPDGTAVPDALFFGEAEASLPAFLRAWRTAGGAKRERLSAAAAGLDGFWVTGSPPPIPVRQAIARGNAVPASPQPLPDVETAGTARLPVGAGCAAFCSFCFEGYERKPYREFPVAEVLAQARSLKAACGASTVELDAFNLNTYAELAPLVEQCVRLFDKVSFKSQRADGIAACPQIIDLERAAGKSSYTLGIEGISSRLRAFLCKSLSDDEITAAVKALLDRRVRELKLFYILTAHETPDDLDAFSDFCSHVRSWLSAPNACTRVVLSFGRLVRMPNTPLAFDRLFLDEAEWRFSVDGVAAACRRSKLECRFAFDWPDYLGTQLLAACGHEHAEAVVRLACQGLTCHAPWHPQEAARLQTELLTRPENLGASSRPPCLEGVSHAAFPFVKRAVTDAFLRARWDSARQFLDAGTCLGGTCDRCYACADSAERHAITGHPRALTILPDVIETVARIEADKHRLVPLYLRAVLPADFAGHSPEWVSASLMQHLLVHHPALTEHLLSVDEALFSFGDNGERLAIPSGETVVRFRAWDTVPLLAALAQETDLFPDAKPLPPGFAPGVFARATWTIATATTARDAAQQASAWLKDLHLPHTLRRNGESWQLDFAPAARKKKCVFALSVAPLSSGASLIIDFSPKAALRDLLARLPPLPNAPRTFCTTLEQA